VVIQLVLVTSEVQTTTMGMTNSSNHSPQGNPHAKAAAYHFGDRCIGLGMNAPLLPNDVTNDIGIVGALGYEQFRKTENSMEKALLDGN
jgi:hypothetical protein